MQVAPKVRGFICTTAHPQGCSAHVQQQIAYAKQHAITSPIKNVLVIGASTGYGLASRIASSFQMGAATIGVFFEKPASDKRTASAGWYNTTAFEQAAQHAGIYAKSINGDAFSTAIRQQTIDLIKQDLGKIDLVIYSLASPRRTDPKTGMVYQSVLKTTDKPFINKTVNPLTGEVSQVTIEPATQEEIDHTVAVMGGADWQLWINDLLTANVLNDEALTLAYSYIGPELTYPIYHHGTIGRAKADLDRTAHLLNQQLQKINGKAYISVNKAVVTQSSAAIPVVPLYISLLFKVMKEKNLHEGCIEQISRLFQQLYGNETLLLDEENRIRLDNFEMREDVQQAVMQLWQQVNSDNIYKISDLKGYLHNFYQLFGFELDNIDYQADVNIGIAIPSLK
ncbi:MAG: trans-2-enoyl-CoA reductase family protein [Legionellales bacterium]|nr:trans-2-enoyl-CoA reductase family protein [Legionellales bacterium]